MRNNYSNCTVNARPNCSEPFLVYLSVIEGTLEEVKDIAEKFNDFSNLILYHKGFSGICSFLLFFFFLHNKPEKLSGTKNLGFLHFIWCQVSLRSLFLTDLPSLGSDVLSETFEHFGKVIIVYRNKPSLRSPPQKARGNKLDGKWSGFVRSDRQYNVSSLHKKSSVNIFVNIKSKY